MSVETVSRHGVRPLLLAGRIALLGLGLALAGCQTDGTGMAGGGSRTLAFESIDGPPKATFEKLVGHLTTEAEAQKVAVVSRSEPAAYRVRGYLAVNSSKDKTSVAYVWDVFDASKQRVARLSGEEVVKRVKGDAWQVCDENLLNKIAGTSMASLAETIGISPSVAQAAPQQAAPAVAESAPAAPAQAEPPAAAPASEGTPVAEVASSAPLAFAAQ
ncbi:hypothetical protein ABLE91_07430 [Aquabacter sp. CN5-332]|uniref:hypothetical protein n=1 Tax=Aquabacter sp. CN5-332 TaxID=3156608 RepID=UPI0032B41786